MGDRERAEEEAVIVHSGPREVFDRHEPAPCGLGAGTSHLGEDPGLAAMEHVVHESEALGVSAAPPRFVRDLARRAVAHGHGGEGYAAMVELFRAPSEIRS
ncbi:hypothetical protein CQJ94_12120 [Glycomyces fuscus]|nr:hypothetical protein CQJ94_12120 [Glycomyces fuscus]